MSVGALENMVLEELREQQLLLPPLAKPEMLRRAKSGGGTDVRIAAMAFVPGILQRAESAPVAQAIASPVGLHSLCEKGSLLPSQAADGGPRKRCAICLEEQAAGQLHVSGKMCGNSHCAEAFCSGCLKAFFQERVESSRFSLQPMLCAACRCHVPVAQWQQLAGPTTSTTFAQNASDALALRCEACDNTHTLLQDAWQHDDLEGAIRIFFNCSRDPEAVEVAWSAFNEGRLDADSFLESLRAHGPEAIRDAEPEVRWACKSWGVYTFEELLECHGEDAGRTAWKAAEVVDTSESMGVERRWDFWAFSWGAYTLEEFTVLHGEEAGQAAWEAAELANWVEPEKRWVCKAWGDYTQEQFILWHGEDSGHVEWEAAEVYRSSTRQAGNGRTYTLEEFKGWYGEEQGQQMWDQAPVVDLSRVFRLLGDVERRAALHLAQVRRNPKILTPCCGMEFCFRCQTSGWHSGTACEEILASQAAIELQFCPACGVPTQRTEGCSSMVCLCGEHWTWSGEESDDDY